MARLLAWASRAAIERRVVGAVNSRKLAAEKAVAPRTVSPSVGWAS